MLVETSAVHFSRVALRSVLRCACTSASDILSYTHISTYIGNYCTVVNGLNLYIKKKKKKNVKKAANI